jgi:hypothetical protein
VYGRFTNDSFKRTSKCKLHLVGVEDVRWEGSGTEPAGLYTFFYGKGNENCEEFGTGFFVHKRIISAVMKQDALALQLPVCHKQH